MHSNTLLDMSPNLPRKTHSTQRLPQFLKLRLPDYYGANLQQGFPVKKQWTRVRNLRLGCKQILMPYRSTSMKCRGTSAQRCLRGRESSCRNFSPVTLVGKSWWSFSKLSTIRTPPSDTLSINNSCQQPTEQPGKISLFVLKRATRLPKSPATRPQRSDRKS